MRKFIFFSLVFFVVFSVNCSKKKWEGRIYEEQGVRVVESRGSGLWGEKSEKKVKFKEELSLGVEEGEEYLVFYGYPRVAVDPELNIFVLDTRNHRLLKFDKMGRFIWKTGRRGQGPGEFQNPSQVEINPSGDICILDGSSRLHFFDNEGNYQKTIKPKTRIRSFHFLPDERLLLNISVSGQMGVAAEYYSNEGKFLKTFPREFSYGPKFQGGASTGEEFRFLETRIYLSLPYVYEIREYDLDGLLLRKIKRDIMLKPPEIDVFEKGFSASFYDRSGPCHLYRGNTLINELLLAEKKNEEECTYKRVLDFFNEKGQFLGTYNLPQSTRLALIDSENKFYFVQSEPYPRIIRSTSNIK